MSAPQTIPVALGQSSYDILVGEGLIAGAGALIAPLARARRIVVVTDENVRRLQLQPLIAGLDTAGLMHETVVLPPGEGTKDFAHFALLAEKILALGVERATLLVALGGGVIGDLAGFTAATLLRGLDYVQVPTTLLAQVDSAVGGKTGINTAQGKNLVGAFHQPVLVIADVGTLATLPRRELLAGYAEVTKYGLIRDRGFFEWLERNGAKLIDGDRASQIQAVAESCRQKAGVVAADERESGERALLNFGHTFGHALEAETGFGPDLLHGEAVALGMALAFDLSVHLRYCAQEDAVRMRRHLAAIGLATELRGIAGRRFAAEALIAHMRRDKKVRDGKLRFILVRAIGEAFIAPDIAEAAILEVLGAACC